jgi:uncharacterized protein
VEWPELLAALLAVFTGALLQGSVGFGGGLVSAPIVVLFQPLFVPGPAILLSTIVSLVVAGREHGSYELSDLRWGLLGRLPGTVLGVWIVTRVSPEDIGLVVGPTVLIAVLLVSLGRAVPRNHRTLFTAGIVSSAMSTSASVGGPPMALLYHDAAGPELRGSMSVYIGFGSVLSVAMLALAGRFGGGELLLTATLLPAALLGVAVSRRSAARLDLGGTRLAVLVLSAASATVLLVNTVWGG